MSRVLIYLGRFAIIILGYCVAALAASLFLNVVYVGAAGFNTAELPWVVTGSLLFSVPFVALFVGYFAFLPSIPIILLAELSRQRGWLYYALSGGVTGAVVVAFIRGAADAGNAAAIDPQLALAVIGSGMVGGIAYWISAGRWAGSWRDRAIATYAP